MTTLHDMGPPFLYLTAGTPSRNTRLPTSPVRDGSGEPSYGDGSGEPSYGDTTSCRAP